MHILAQHRTTLGTESLVDEKSAMAGDNRGSTRGTEFWNDG